MEFVDACNLVTPGVEEFDPRILPVGHPDTTSSSGSSGSRISALQRSHRGWAELTRAAPTQYLGRRSPVQMAGEGGHFSEDLRSLAWFCMICERATVPPHDLRPISLVGIRSRWNSRCHHTPDEAQRSSTCDAEVAMANWAFRLTVECSGARASTRVIDGARFGSAVTHAVFTSTTPNGSRSVIIF